MQFNPATLDYQKAKSYLASPASYLAAYEQCLFDMLDNCDYWQGGLRYLGPTPAPGAGYAAGMLALQKSFAPILKCREVLKRHVRGVCGREPAFELAFDQLPDKRTRKKLAAQSKLPSDARIAFANDADATQGAWWDERGGHEITLAFARRLRATGAAYLRYDVPPGLIVEGADRTTGQLAEGVSAGDWKEALNSIYFEVCARGSASIRTDPWTMKQTAFYSYSEGEGVDRVQCVQISWVETDADGLALTHVRIVKERGEDREWTCDTGGHLLVIEARMDALLTPDLLRLQDIMSAIATMIKLNSDVAGFPSMDGVDIDKPATINAGARSYQFYYSQQEKDGDGNPIVDTNNKPVVRSGTLHYRTPVSSQPLREDIDYFETQLYRGVSQGHIAARKSANASAAMLVEDRADYADSLLETKPHIEKPLRTLMIAVLCLAAHLAGDTAALEVFKTARVNVTCHLNAGPLSVEEKNEILARYQANLLSRETAMVMLGTEDVDAEIEKLAEDEKRKAEAAKQMAVTMADAKPPEAMPAAPKPAAS